MASFSSSDSESAPSDTDTDTGTRSVGRVARCVECIAGPLAIGASGVTFFLAFTLTVPQPDDLVSSGNPVLTVAAAEPSAETTTTPALTVRQVAPVTVPPKAPTR